MQEHDSEWQGGLGEWSVKKQVSEFQGFKEESWGSCDSETLKP
jgi:hypothetical protein